MSDIAFKVLIGNGYDDVLFKTIMLKGEKGDKGEAGGAEIDDSTISSSKTWSSNKINSEISAKPSAFSQLSDVAISNISDGQMAVYNSATGKWKNQSVDASTLKYNSTKTIKAELDEKASSLTDLDDVSITNPQNEQGMIYDATTGKWKNGDIAKFTNTASGSIVHITDGADNIPVKSLASEIVAVQSGSGTPSPSNPRAISGFANGIVSVCGKNLLSLNNVDFTLKSVRYYTSDGNFYLNGTSTGETSSRDESFRTNLNFLLKAGTYYFSRGNLNIATYLYDYEDNTKPAIVTNSGSFTLTEDTRVYIGFYVYNQTFNNLKSEIMVNIGSSATPYEAYNGNTYTFAFGQTVYGGHFDNKGNLVSDFANDRLDSKSWTYNSGRGAFNTIFSGKNQSRFTEMICSCYENGGQVYSASDIASKPDKAFYTQANSDTVFIKDSDYTDPTTWLNALGSNTLCYPLTTPTSLTITSQDIPTLSGENNIFSNCGDVEVEYYTYKSNDILDFVDSEIGKKNGTNILIEENSPDSIKDYIDNGLSGKADTSDLNDKQDKNVLNIVKHYDSGTSSDAITDIITEYGKVNMVFAFDVPLGYFTGCLTFANDNMGSGFIVLSTTGRFWVVSYVSGTITLTELT